MLTSVQPKPYPMKQILIGVALSLALGAFTWELANLANETIKTRQNAVQEEPTQIEVLNQSDQYTPAWSSWKSGRTDGMQQ